MGKIKRKQKQRKIVKRHTMPKLTDEQLSTIPPHLLDKIPSSMSLKPNAQTMRSMMMQRLAPPFVQMPLMTPQQQQAQSLKTSNDIKEQTVNQAKQDLIVERDRQANLQREAANVKVEEQRIKHKRKFDNELHQVQLQKKQVDFDKEMMSENNDIVKQKRELENIQALVQQAKFENQRLTNKIEQDEYANKIKSLKKELNLITAENEGLRNAADKLIEEDQLKNIAGLMENITKQRAKNLVLMKINQMHNEMLDNKLESKCRIPSDTLDLEITAMENSIKNYQTALAQQRLAQIDYDHTKARHDYYVKEYNDTMVQNVAQEIENSKKQEEINSFSSPTKKEEIRKLKTKQARQEADRQLLDAKMELESEIQSKQFEIDKNNAMLEYMKSSEYLNGLRDIHTKEKLKQHTEEQARLSEENTAAYKELVKQEVRNEVAGTVEEAVLNGNDVVGSLQGMYQKIDENPNYINQYRRQQIFEKAIAQLQTTNDESNERAKVAKDIIAIYNSEGIAKNAFEEFMRKEAGEITIDDLVQKPLPTLNEILTRVQTLRDTRIQQADKAVEQDDDENDFLK